MSSAVAPTIFTRPLADITVTENQSLHLECAINQPDKKAQWFCNENEVSVSARINIDSKGKVHLLRIDSCELSDAGVYKIVVDGVTCQAKVHVKGKNTLYVSPFIL